MDGCLACDLMSGRRPLPGGEILRTERWVISHCVGPLGLGTLIVAPARHLTHVAELSSEESAALGPLLQRATAIAGELVEAEQVYCCLWSHADGVPGHIHFVVQPVTRAQLDELGVHGPALQMAMFTRGDVPDADAVEQIADRARAAFASG